MAVSTYRKMIRIGLIGTLMLTVLGIVVTFAPVQAQGYEPVFESVDCWFTLPESQSVECGYLIVPENRDNPDGDQVRVATAILRHPGGSPEPDPIVYIHGGPGGGVMSIFELAWQGFVPFFETNRDVIYFDQRGGGLSEPSLDCPNFVAAVNEVFDLTLDGEPLTNSEAQGYTLDALIECGEEWSQKADLSTYDSPNTAADINDLRIALGYDQINIYAESYGPRVAQSVMRDYPETVRSAVLDASMSTYAPLEIFPKQTGQMLSQLFEYCAADEACDTAYPDLRNVWLKTRRQFGENPVSLTGTNPFTGEEVDFLVDDGMLSTVLWRLSYSSDTLSALPAFIYAVSQGDYALLQRALGGKVAGIVALASWGNWFNVTCRQRAPISSAENFEAALAEYPESRGFHDCNLFFSTHALFTEELCQAWGDGVVPESEHEPVASDIPTILVLGDTDPASFLEGSMRIAEPLENSFGPYSYPFMSHVVYGAAECPTNMVNAFIIDPTTEPDASCMDEMGATFDSPSEGSSELALEPFTNEEMGFSTLIPAGWEELDPGLYTRSNPGIDPTFFIQMAVPSAASEEAVGGIMGEFGASELSDPVDSFESDSLSWNFYEPEGQLPMVLGLSEKDDMTYIVVVVSATELDQLIDTLLVPVVEVLTPTE